MVYEHLPEDERRERAREMRAAIRCARGDYDDDLLDELSDVEFSTLVISALSALVTLAAERDPKFDRLLDFAYEELNEETR